MIQAPGMCGRPQHIYSHDISVFSHRERDELNSVSYPIIQSIYISSVLYRKCVRGFGRLRTKWYVSSWRRISLSTNRKSYRSLKIPIRAVLKGFTTLYTTTTTAESSSFFNLCLLQQQTDLLYYYVRRYIVVLLLLCCIVSLFLYLDQYV
jgi:hypothetical protein